MRAGLVLLALVLTIEVGISTAAAGLYISGNTGYVSAKDARFEDSPAKGKVKFDPGSGISAALGYRSGDRLRTEIEAAFRQTPVDCVRTNSVGVATVEGEFSTFSLLANAFYHLLPEQTVSPFIGGGLGGAKVETRFQGDGSEDDLVFAYQLAVGIDFAVSQKGNIDLQYRFFATSEIEHGSTDLEYTTHNLLLGFRYHF
ncbi:MAG: porin family protein [Desulfuromonadales bacterium]|nr:porin family protein [Desulfuromonadales bacterium]